MLWATKRRRYGGTLGVPRSAQLARSAGKAAVRGQAALDAAAAAAADPSLADT